MRLGPQYGVKFFMGIKIEEKCYKSQQLNKVRTNGTKVSDVAYEPLLMIDRVTDNTL